MHRSITRLAVAFAMIAVLAAGVVGVPSRAFAAASALQDPCPEPNDAFQAACRLPAATDTLGTVGHADDVDAYRFEVVDFDTMARVVLADLPAPYEAYIADWRGDLIASSVPTGDRSELAQAALKMPGSYYVFVRSKTGQFDAGQRYRLSLDVDYGGRPARQALYSQDVAPDEDRHGTSPDGNVDFARSGGRFTMGIKKPGSDREPVFGTAPLQVVAQPDFLVVSDVRVVGGTRTGFQILVGVSEDWETSYNVTVDVTKNEVSVTRRANGARSTPVRATPIGVADQAGGVNRIVVQGKDGKIRVHLNGTDILNLAGQDVPAGRVVLQTVSWGEPVTVVFDNTLVTAPAGS
jgi:hypothetical protein